MEESIITRGVIDDDVDSYLASLNRIKQTLSELVNLKLKAADPSIQKLVCSSTLNLVIL